MGILQTSTVPTKTYSGSSPAPATLPGAFDAFAYYSDDRRRMNKLLLQGAESTAASSKDSASSKKASSCPAPPERKSRLSFEVHPSLILDSPLHPEGDISSSLRAEDDGDADLDLLLDILCGNRRQ